MFLIVGLGNPGKNYEKTRHNAGFMAVDFISNRHNFLWEHKTKFKADIATGIINMHKVVICKPTTFMNLSGEAVLPILSYYKIDIKNLIVIHDDIDLDFGELRYRFGGSASGHNGLKSINKACGQDYTRIKIGVGRPDKGSNDVSDYVLSNFSNAELAYLHNKYEVIFHNINLLFSLEIEKFKLAIKLV